MKRLTLPMLLLALAITPTAARAAEGGPAPSRAATNTVYLEALGAGLLYSINYERIVGDVVPLRLGLSVFKLEEATFVLVPVGASYLLGNTTHSLELGAGVTLGTASSVDGSGPQPVVTLPATVGYRYQPADGGFLFRAAFMPTVLVTEVYIGGGADPVPYDERDPDGVQLVPTFGVSVGYAF